jgi:hypothetical protein
MFILIAMLSAGAAFAARDVGHGQLDKREH